MQQKLKRFCTFLYLYVFYVCASFHCIWRSRFKVICTLVSALKSKMAAISMETKRGNFVLFFFSIFFILIIINVKWNEWIEKWTKQFFDQHLPLTGPINGSYTLVFPQYPTHSLPLLSTVLARHLHQSKLSSYFLFILGDFFVLFFILHQRSHMHLNVFTLFTVRSCKWVCPRKRLAASNWSYNIPARPI